MDAGYSGTSQQPNPQYGYDQTLARNQSYHDSSSMNPNYERNPVIYSPDSFHSPSLQHPHQHPTYPTASSSQSVPSVSTSTWKRFAIPTKNDSLSSGFPFHPRLYDLRVTHDEWHLFTNALVTAGKMTVGEDWGAWTTGITAGTLATPVLLVLAPVVGYYSGKAVHRKALVKTVKEKLGEEGGLREVLVKWNETWRAKGFQAWLEVPRDPGELLEDLGTEAAVGESTSKAKGKKKEKEMKKIQKKAAKRFRIIILPVDDDMPPGESESVRSLDSSSAGYSHAPPPPAPLQIEDAPLERRSQPGDRMTMPPPYADSTADEVLSPLARNGPPSTIRTDEKQEVQRQHSGGVPDEIRYSRPDGFTNT